jgi:ribosome biogenesis GTPase
MPNTGQVITRFGAELIVEDSQSQTLIRCTARRKLEHLACGDWVEWEAQSQGNAAVTRLLTRKNVLERPDFRGKARAIAANVDLMLIVSSWQPSPSWELIDRYLITAQRLQAEAILVMNKRDLRAKFASAHDETCLAELAHIGYPILHTDAKLADDVSVLKNAIKTKTAIMVGQSGVGKSSLAQQLLPELDIKVGSIADTGEGRHTTTSATLYRLSESGNLIDSPGVRDFGLLDLDFATLENGYLEFKAYLGQCRFNNCTHNHEPGCAVKTALSAGELLPQRYARYLALLKTI